MQLYAEVNVSSSSYAGRRKTTTYSLIACTQPPQMSPSSTLNGPDQSPVQETTPLLASPAGKTNQESLTGNASHTNVDNRPLPKAQIFVLCYARLIEPIAFFSIFPFVNQMIWETSHLNEADVGFYSGLIVRLYAPVMTMNMEAFLTCRHRNRYFL